MEKLGLGDARQILAMLQGEEVASSRLSPHMASNSSLYDRQYAIYKDMKVTDPRLLGLVDMIHHYRKGYEQEGYIKDIIEE